MGERENGREGEWEREWERGGIGDRNRGRARTEADVDDEYFHLPLQWGPRGQ